jgi:hypothetical protein
MAEMRGQMQREPSIWADGVDERPVGGKQLLDFLNVAE